MRVSLLSRAILLTLFFLFPIFTIAQCTATNIAKTTGQATCDGTPWQLDVTITGGAISTSKGPGIPRSYEAPGYCSQNYTDCDGDNITTANQNNPGVNFDQVSSSASEVAYQWSTYQPVVEINPCTTGCSGGYTATASLALQTVGPYYGTCS